MQSWDLKTVGVEPHEPQILASGRMRGRSCCTSPPGKSCSEHEVHERARIVVVEGEVTVSTPSGEGVSAGPGHLLEFEPGERHTVAAGPDSRLLLVLSPWPGDGHPGAMTLEQKAEARSGPPSTESHGVSPVETSPTSRDDAAGRRLSPQ